MLPAGDAELVQIVDSAVADAARRSGAWLKCAPGCTQCCYGVFAISPLDAARLRDGLALLDQTYPERAAAVRRRAGDARTRLASEFPGDPATGTLDDARADEFESFGNDEPCPALDRATGFCDLYAARPMTCRVFGPPLRTAEGLGVCELCFDGASAEEVVRCELHLDTDDLEATLTAEVEQSTEPSGPTIIAWALNQ